MAPFDKWYNFLYTFSMKTAVSIPDPVFQSAEAMASKLGMTRSALYAEALVAWLKEKKSQEITAQINEALKSCPQQVDPFMREAARQGLARVEW